MPVFTVSRGAYAVHTTKIEADTADEAIDKAKKIGLNDWDWSGDNEQPLYQIEDEENTDD